MAKRKPAKSAAPAWGIKQSELEAWRSIHADIARLKGDLETRRETLMKRTLEGATIEPGDLVPQIATREVHRITAAEIGRILGLDVLALVRTQISPSIERSFSVVLQPDPAQAKVA